MKIHLVGFPHRRMDRETTCGFSAKGARFNEMMTARGHEVIAYDGEAKFEGHQEWDGHNPMWRSYNKKIVDLLRHEDGVICLLTGDPHADLVHALPGRPIVEYAIGYRGVLAEGTHRVFESYAWMHWIGGKAGDLSGRPGDTVICNFYPAPEFPLGENQGYLLFVGRPTVDKGVRTVIEVANKAGVELVTVGPGRWSMGIDHRGIVSTEERNKLMSNALAVICPTEYVEPGCSVAHEALMCGTPVISTDWGCFPEFVENGHTGYRCSSVDEMVRAVHDVEQLNRRRIREHAQRQWSYNAAAPLFERYFERIG